MQHNTSNDKRDTVDESVIASKSQSQLSEYEILTEKDLMFMSRNARRALLKKYGLLQ